MHAASSGHFSSSRFERVRVQSDAYSPVATRNAARVLPGAPVGATPGTARTRNTSPSTQDEYQPGLKPDPIGIDTPELAPRTSNFDSAAQI